MISSSLSLVDNLMVGAMGETELAAVGIAIQIFFVHWMVMFGFTSGSATFMAQFYGVLDLKSIRKTVGFAISVCFSVSLLFFAAGMFFPHAVIRLFTDIPEAIELGTDYIRMGAPCFLLISISVPFTSVLRATQQTQLPLYISITAFATNTFLNYVFIFGHFGAPQMGVIGAALATVISRTLETALAIYVVFGRKNMVSGPLRDFFSFNRAFALRIVHNAIPTTLNETLWGLGTAMYTAAFARMSITAYAAVQASNTINNLFIMAGFSLGDAALILLGEKLGEGKKEYAYELAKKLLKITFLVGIVAGALLAVCSRAMVGFFDFTPLGESYAIKILLIYSVIMPINLFNGAMITGVLRGGGDTRFAMIFEVLCVWGIGVPTAFITTQLLEFPIYLAVLCVKLADVVELFILLKRMFSKRWLNTVIYGMSGDATMASDANKGKF